MVTTVRLPQTTSQLGEMRSPTAEPRFSRDHLALGFVHLLAPLMPQHTGDLLIGVAYLLVGWLHGRSNATFSDPEQIG